MAHDLDPKETQTVIATCLEAIANDIEKIRSTTRDIDHAFRDILEATPSTPSEDEPEKSHESPCILAGVLSEFHQHLTEIQMQLSNMIKRSTL